MAGRCRGRSPPGSGARRGAPGAGGRPRPRHTSRPAPPARARSQTSTVALACIRNTIDSEGFKGGTRGAPIMPRDAVSRTANVERTGRHKWVETITTSHT